MPEGAVFGTPRLAAPKMVRFQTRGEITYRPRFRCRLNLTSAPMPINPLPKSTKVPGSGRAFTLKLVVPPVSTKEIDPFLLVVANVLNAVA